MFDNIGGKIKALAQVVCWVGIIASVIIGIGLADEIGFIGVIVMIIAAVFSWVSSFTLYGFGQLIENTDELVRSKKPTADIKNAELSDAKRKDSQKSEQKDNYKRVALSDFDKEIMNTDTAELQLIVDELQHLYTEEEITLIKYELSNRRG